MTITCPNCKTEFPLTQRALAGQIEGEVARRVASARTSLAAEAERNARTVTAAAAEEKDRALEALRASIGEYRDKLAVAQVDQLELERTRNALAQKLGEVDLEVERRLRERLEDATASIKETVEQKYVLQIQDQKVKLDQARAHAEELQRRLEQGSQQIQGESAEIGIETELRAAFPGDTFTPVATGDRGGDLIQTVVAQGGHVCGKILWESKRTKN